MSALTSFALSAEGVGAGPAWVMTLWLASPSVTGAVHDVNLAWLPLGMVAAALGIVALLHIRYLASAQAGHRESDYRFQQMAGSIAEVFWMVDLRTRQVLYVNEAWTRMTQLPQIPPGQPLAAYLDLVHPDDRAAMSTRLEAARVTGIFDEKFRIIRPDGAKRWIRVRGLPVRFSVSTLFRMFGTAEDITDQRLAQEKAAQQLIQTDAARRESDALRRATLAVTQEVQMDHVLDRILQCLMELVPCERARLHLLEDGSRFFLAREFTNADAGRADSLQTLDAGAVPRLAGILNGSQGVLVEDTTRDPAWRAFEELAQRSWLAVPLRAYGQMLGFVSLGDPEPCRFTKEHLRRTEMLAIPAAIAIQNARLYERAEIFAEQLQKRAAGYSGLASPIDGLIGDRSRRSSGIAQQIFQFSPVACSLATLEGGRFLEANSAFQQRYGYSERELLSHAITEHELWESSPERARIAVELRSGRPVHNFITRFRCKSGEFKLTLYSAVGMRLNETLCVLAASVDLVALSPGQTN